MRPGSWLTPECAPPPLCPFPSVEFANSRFSAALPTCLRSRHFLRGVDVASAIGVGPASKAGTCASVPIAVAGTCVAVSACVESSPPRLTSSSSSSSIVVFFESLFALASLPPPPTPKINLVSPSSRIRRQMGKRILLRLPHSQAHRNCDKLQTVSGFGQVARSGDLGVAG